MRRIVSLLLVAVLTAGCSSGEEGGGQSAEDASLAQARADTMAMAAAAFDVAAFDTISWGDDQAALDRGATVFRFSCQKCHGPDGEGDGGFVMQGDTLRPPTFLAVDWQYADDMDGLREQVYVGSLEGMPHWGLEGLSYRDVDAVSRYIVTELRPSN